MKTPLGDFELPQNRWLRMLVIVAAMGVLVAVEMSRQNAPNGAPRQGEERSRPAATATPSAPVVERTAPVAKPAPPATPATSTSGVLVVRNLTLRDADGRTIYRGDIDLRPTLARIESGRTLRFSHDGSTFQNREGRLPRQPSGYYREWVVPTPDEDGPGPQRIVTGEAGEAWYTADHYRTFRRLDYTLQTSSR